MNWFQAGKFHGESFFDTEQIDDAKYKTRCLATIDGFHALFHELVKELKIRDEWPDWLCNIAPFTTGTVECSAKLNQQFSFFICPDGWCIEAGLRYSECIRHMTDEFWGQITVLSKIGKASLSDSCILGTSAETKRLLQHKGSLVFSLARDYILLMQAPRDSIDSRCGSIGHIEVVLPFESDEKTVRNFYKDGLMALYRANYLLHRSAYLEFKRLEKKFTDKKPEAYPDRNL